MAQYKNGGCMHKTSLQVQLQWHIYDYSFEENELNATPMLVWEFVATTTTFVAWWWWMYNWQCSSTSQITSTTKKTSFVVLWSLTQKNAKKLDSN